MAHSHDRTLLARLGFADPDKQSALHELLCFYLCFGPGRNERILDMLQRTAKPELVFSDVQNFSCTTEYPISKGEKQYKTTIGFLDALLYFNLSVQNGAGSKQSLYSLLCNVEIKISIPSISEVIRQIQLYREYPVDLGQHTLDSLSLQHALSGQCFSLWCLVTLDDVSPIDRQVLKKHDIWHYCVGPDFHTWANERIAERAAIHAQNVRPSDPSDFFL